MDDYGVVNGQSGLGELGGSFDPEAELKRLKRMLGEMEGGAPMQNVPAFSSPGGAAPLKSVQGRQESSGTGSGSSNISGASGSAGGGASGGGASFSMPGSVSATIGGNETPHNNGPLFNTSSAIAELQAHPQGSMNPGNFGVFANGPPNRLRTLLERPQYVRGGYQNQLNPFMGDPGSKPMATNYLRQLMQGRGQG